MSYVFVSILFASIISATFYPYDQKITITDSDGSYMGYVLPYQAEVLFQKYAYLKWKREGFPEGNSFPFALITGTTTALPFGIQGELLRVKINSISSSGVDLTIDKSDVITEIQNIPETLPENVEAIQEDVQERVEPAINEINKQLEKFNNDIGLRINKAINRNYHSSLHIIDTSNAKLREISRSIKNKEAELAEDIADDVVSAVINYAFIAYGIPGAGTIYSVLIKQFPADIRHDITNFIYNIEDTSDSVAEANLADKGIATLYIGNPNSNKVSKQFNEELKRKGLPYFDGNKIIGKRTYSSQDIGIVVAIPEETYWDKNTLQNRWDNDRIRLYKTLIAGIGDEGLKASALWYNKQLDLAKNSISGIIKLIGASADEAGLETNEILSQLWTVAKNDPKASIGFATIAQGWIMTAISSLQEPDFNKIDSLGYVVILQKQGNSFKTLETYSLIGNTKNYFLDEYQEIANQVGDVAENVQEIVGNAANPITMEKVVQDSNPAPTPEPAPKVDEKKTPEKITGRVVEEVKETGEEEIEEEPEPKKEIPIISWVVNIFKRWFG